MKYAIISAVHGRPHIAEAWAAWLALHFMGQVYVAGDDEDIHARMRKHLGDRLRWVPYCNQPLGAKWNRAAETATTFATLYGITHLLVLGSDDFPSPALLQAWQLTAEENCTFAGLDCLYFHSLAKSETSILNARTSIGAFGTGRMYQRSAFEDLFRTRGYAWEPELSCGLDRSLWCAMGHPGQDAPIFTDDQSWCMAVKSEEQIWSYEHVKARCNMPVVTDDLPESAKEFLTWLRTQPMERGRQRPRITHN